MLHVIKSEIHPITRVLIFNSPYMCSKTNKYRGDVFMQQEKTSDNMNEHESLKKSSSPAQMWALALGAMIGWGCFILPELLFLPSAGPMASVMGIALGAGMICMVALCCGMLIKLYPVAGGSFAYSFVGLGPKAAFICGWGLVLTYTCAIAANGTALIILTRFLLPDIFNFGHLYTVSGWDIYVGELIMLSVVFTLFAYSNYKGMDFASSIQFSLSLALVLGVVALTFGALTTETASIENLKPFFAENRAPLYSVFAIFALAPFLFGGFDTIPQAAEEFNFPAEKSTSLMITAILCGAAMYSVVLISVAIVMPYPEFLATGSAWLTGDVAVLSFGKFGGIVLAVPVAAAIFSGINGFFLAASRLLLSMGRAQSIPIWFEHIDHDHKTPRNAIIFIWALVLVAPWVGRPFLSWLLDTMAVSMSISYIFTCITAYRLACQYPALIDYSNPKFISMIGIVMSTASMLLLIVPGSPGAISSESLLMCAGWIAVGYGFYMSRASENAKISPEEMKKMILGDIDSPLLFGKKK